MTFHNERLGNVAEIIRGITFKPDDLIPKEQDGAVVCFRTKNVQRALDESDLIAVPPRFVARKDQIVQSGDILVSSANSWNLVGKCCYVPPLNYRATAGGFISILRADSRNLDNRYLYHWFSSPNVQTLLRSFGRKTTNISNLNIGLTLDTKIPLPPLEEQRRIAEVLDRADALRQKRRLALQKLDTLLQSVFLDMFGDTVRNPIGWPLKPLAEVFEFTTGKLDSNAMVAGGQYPFFTCSRETFEIDRYAFDCEALLLAGNNATADYSVKHYKGKFNAYQRTYVITLKNSQDSYIYMKAALERKLRDLKRISKGTNTKYLTLGLLNDLKIQVPDPEYQKAFANWARETERVRLRQEGALSCLHDLFSSIQLRSFRRFEHGG